MADNAQNDRLQPSLLDRLTDSQPDSQRETREERVIDIRRLRDIVQRDLSWLLNTTNNDGWLDAERFPNASRSAINYGVREVAGDFSTDEKAEQIRRAIRHAIETFEPRIRAGSAVVDLNIRDVDRKAVIAFDIRADMWAEPVPMELYLRSEIDLTTGEISVVRS
jgi:type VI secretion system protein ImpF